MKILALVYLYFTLGWQLIAPKEQEPNFYQLDCRIYDESGVLIATFAGFTCSFASNGEWLSLRDNTLRLFDSRNQLKYTFPYFVHHELRFSRDEQKIYFLSEDRRMYKGQKTRFDVINVADKNGKLLHSWNTADHIALLTNGRDPDLDKTSQPIDKTAPDVTNEFSHLNTISEIPPNAYEFILPYMKRGNLLVTFNGLGKIIIFNPELSRIEHIFEKYIHLYDYGFHDAQILPNGHLIFFKNLNYPDRDTYTSLEEYDVLFRKRVWTFKFEPPKFLLNKINGTIQVLSNGNIFISDSSYGGRAVELKRNGEIVWMKYNERMDNTTHLPVMIYRAKKIAADKFFMNNIAGAVIE